MFFPILSQCLPGDVEPLLIAIFETVRECFGRGYRSSHSPLCKMGFLAIAER